MQFIDFSNRQNRYIRVSDVDADYYDRLREIVLSDTEYYPRYHIAPKHGLLNDPNGLYQDRAGYYHIYYQWFPLGTVHGLKHWYHLVTKDFIEYQDLGIAVYPDSEFDNHGCYTGMTFNDDGNYHVYYTGIRKKNNQLLPATVHAQIFDNKIVKDRIIEDVDFNRTTDNFRDPCVFKRDGKYYMLTGAENTQKEGVILISASENSIDFKPVGTLALLDYPYGYMLECPTYFENELQGVLVFSPQGIAKRGRYDFQNVFSVVYAVGERLDFSNNRFWHDTFYELDKGFDFYAPQIFTDNIGRKILYGWLGNSKCEYPSDKNQWAHMLTIPRLVEITGDRLKQWPLPELTKLKKNCQVITQRKALVNKYFCLEFDATEIFEFSLVNNSEEKLVFSGNQDEYCLDRSITTHLYNEIYGQKRYAVREDKGVHRIIVFVDCSAIEIFADNGLTVFTSRFYLDGDWRLEVQDMNADYYELTPIKLVG